MYSNRVSMFFFRIPHFWNLAFHGLPYFQITPLHQVRFQCHVSTSHLGTLTQIYHHRPLQKHIWNTVFSIFISNLFLFLFLLPPVSLYLGFSSYLHSYTCIRQSCFVLLKNYFTSIPSFSFSNSNPSPNQTDFLILLNKLKLWPLHIFLHSSPYGNT